MAGEIFDEILKHFGITEIPKEGLWISQNTEYRRKILGIDAILKSSGIENGKAHIIIDYEVGFPQIVTRVITE